MFISSGYAPCRLSCTHYKWRGRQKIKDSMRHYRHGARERKINGGRGGQTNTQAEPRDDR